MMKKVFAGIVFLLLLVGMYFLQLKMISQQEKVWIQKKLYLIPPPKFTKIFALGNDHLVADILWVRAIQYFGGNYSKMDGTGFKNLIENIITLDPQFRSAYTFGAFAYTEGLDDDDAAVDLLTRGSERIPDYWKLPFDAGFIRFYNQNRIEEAIELFKKTAAIPDCPSYVPRMIPYLYSKEGQDAVAIEIYTRQLEQAKSDFERKLVKEHLDNAYMRRDINLLNNAVIEYQKKTGKDPDLYLENLVTADFIEKLPLEPHGAYYFWDEANEKVDSIHQKYRMKAISRNTMQRTLDYAYKSGHSFPNSLEDAVEKGLIEIIPPDPLGGGWGYNPATGQIAEVTCAREYAPSGLIIKP